MTENPTLPALPDLGGTVPQLLLGALERRYLADFQPAHWRITPAPADSTRPLLRQVQAMGRPPAEEDWSSAMAQVLTACHWHGHSVVMAVHGDGGRQRILIGGRRVPGRSRGSAEDFLEGRASALRAHVPRLQLGEAVPLGEGDTAELSRFLHDETPNAAVVTGIPSARAGRPRRLPESGPTDPRHRGPPVRAHGGRRAADGDRAG